MTRPRHASASRPAAPGILIAAPVIAAVLAAPGPIRAQDVLPPDGTAGLCTQPAALTHRLSAPVATASAPIALDLSIVRSEPRYLEFRVIEPATVTLRTVAQDDSDPHLTLYDLFGNEIARDDDGSGGLDSLMSLSLAPGAYCAQVRVLGIESRDAAIVLRLEAGASTGADTGAADAGFCGGPDTAMIATRDLSGERALVAEAVLSPGVRSGHVRLTVDAETALRIDARSSAFDTVLEIYGSDGSLLLENDDGPGGGTDSRIVNTFAAGELCLAVRAFGDGSGPFEVAVALPGASDGDGGGDATAAACGDPARTVDLGSVAPGEGEVTLSGRLDDDGESFVSLVLPEDGTWQIDVTSPAFDTILTVYDAAGEVLAMNDDGPDTGTDSQLIERLRAGELCLGVSAFGFGTGGFDLTLAAQVRGDPTEVPGPGSGVAVDDLGPIEHSAASTLLSRDPTLWVAFILTAPGPVEIEASSLSGPFTLGLYAEDGTRLAQEVSGGSVAAAQIDATLDAGRYLVAQESEGGGDAIRVRQVVVSRP